MQNITFKFLNKRHATQNVFDEQPIFVSLFAKDRGDFAFLYEDRSVTEDQRYHYVFFTADNLDEPFEHFAFNNAPEAAIHFTYRYLLDNHSDADTNDREAIEKHNDVTKQVLSMCKNFT